MKAKLYPIYFVLCLILSAACGTKEYHIPDNAVAIKENVEIFPDYTDITLPTNIAPLNFMVRSAGENYVAVLKCDKKQLISGAGEDGKIRFNPQEWSSFLSFCKGKTITVQI